MITGKIDVERVKAIAFDADDTLWDCQGHFERVMQQLYTMLLPWTEGSRERAAEELFATERKNMPLLGYGTKAFTLSVLETAMRVSGHEIAVAEVARLQQLCYELVQLPATPLPEVEHTLRALSASERWKGRLSVFTKGELLDQENKLRRSGLGHYFVHTEITSDKGEAEFSALCRHLGIAPDALLMVGNSLKSDIAPALAIGAQAVHIPFSVTWELEHQEDFEHPCLAKITTFADLLPLLSV